MPGPLVSSLLLVALLGAIGGLAAVLVTDDGRLDRLSEDERGVVLGFVSQLIVGAVAAVVVESVNPPDGSWLSLVGGSLAAGVGGQAILLAMVHGKRADAAEKDAAQADQQAQHAKALAEASVRSIAATSKGVLMARVAETNGSTGDTNETIRAALPRSGPARERFGSAIAAIDAERDAALTSLEAAGQPARRGRGELSRSSVRPRHEDDAT